MHAFGQILTDNTPGAKSINIPAGVTSISVELWGGGGGGQGANGNPSAGGGGSGGGYIKANYNVSAGNYNYFVGSGGAASTNGTGSWFVNNTTFLAVGGNGAAATLTGDNSSGVTTTAPATGNIGGSLFSTYGGSGANGKHTNGGGGPYSGGGGSSGGTTASGNAAANTGGAAPTNGYAGANGLTSRNQGNTGGIGAGGSGGLATNTNNQSGGNGGNGQVRVNYIQVTGITPNPVCVGSTITITGANFATGTSTVTINGTACTGVTRVNATTITAVVATATTSGVVIVTNSNGTNNGISITVNPLPAAIAGGATAVCAGGSTPAFTNATGGGTWSVIPGTGNGTITAGGVLTGTSAGTLTVRYTMPSGCYTASGPVTVNPLPATVSNPAPANGATGICYAGTGAVSGISWAAAAGANSYDVYFGAGSLPGSAVNVSTNSYNTGVLLPNTTYYWRVVAKNGCGDAVSSATWSFTTSGTPCYCASSGGTFPDGITGVNFNTINNLGTSVSTGYTDYTSISTTVLKGYTYPLNVYINTGGNYTNYQSAYIDWNGDGDFVDAGEFYNLGTAANVTNGLSSASPLSIAVPAGAVTGSVRMRIQSRYNSAPTGSCQTGFDGEVEDYTINIVPALPCTAPTAQPTNLVLTPSAGTINGSFTAAVPPAYSYLVIMNTTGIAPTPADNVDYAVGSNALGGTNTVVDNDSNTTFTATTLNPLTTYYFFVFSNNNYCTGGTKYLVANPLTGNATTPATTYCSPTTQNNPNYLYINSVSFVGHLNPDFTNTSAFAGGYQDHTGISSIAKQAQGGGINVNASSLTTRGKWRAWIDWNKDGDFDDADETIFAPGSVGQNITFGFVIPPTTPVGKYRIRFRVYNRDPENYSYTYNACESFTGSQRGEAEDYVFEVVANCAANIATVTDGSTCGTGSVALTVTGTPGTTSYQWYTTATGPSAISGATSNSYTTPTITTTTTYYVTALNGSFESLFRVPVVAHIKPTPNVSFTPSAPEVCGEASVVALAAAADKEVVYLINENFESGDLGVFSTVNSDSNSTAVKNLTKWQNLTSTAVPTGPVWLPAISSGFGTNKFVLANSDPSTYATATNENSLTQTGTVNSTGFSNLTLKFKIYYSRYSADGTYLDGLTTSNTAYPDDVTVETSSNGGAWTAVPGGVIIADKGIGTRFDLMTFNLNGLINVTNLKIRIRHKAYATFDGFNYGWVPGGVALDDIELYGEKPMTPSFTWVSTNPIQFYTDAAATVAYNPGDPAANVYIKPDPAQLESYADWNITAKATLSNGCSATGLITIQNKTKTWDTSFTDWANAAAWKPLSSNTVPTADKCVIIKSPVTIGTATDGFAKNIKIETASGATGKLDIAGSLTVTDQINNTGTDADLVIASDANLKQVTDSPVPANSGAVTVKRNIRFRSDARQEYNYLISPVVGQSLKTIYPGVPTTSTYPYVLYYNEASNFFGNSTGAYIAGRGLAVKEPSKAHVPANSMDAVFKGPLANGVITFPLGFTNNVNYGYNLVGNPYASNIDLRTLYTLNGGSLTDASIIGKITSTFYFWDNGANDVYVQQGSGYSGKAYAVYNAVNNTGNAAGYLLTGNPVIGTKEPNVIAKVGQGFLVRATAAANLSFNNSIRTTDHTGAVFFSKSADSTANRYWLQLITPTHLVNSIAVVHFEGGATAFGLDDSELNGSSSDMFYSIAGDHKLQIEGRSVFSDTDKIPLGSAHFSSGIYTIALGKKEGVFANGQHIYLKDRQTGIITDLTAGAYSFSANAGESTGRFEIVYQPETVLATDASVKEDILVYRDGTDFVVKAASKKITDLQVYDGAGRLIQQMQPNSLQALIHSEKMSNGAYLLKINQAGATVVKKILK